LAAKAPTPEKRSPAGAGLASRELLALFCSGGNLLLPGALLVTMQAQLLASLAFVDFGFQAFFH